MSYQFNFASSEKLIHQVTLEELDAVRKVMLKASFELFEIKHIEGKHVSETWKQSGTDRQICLEIIGEANVEEIEEPATLQNVVDELVDLWIELRAIRNNTLCAYDENENFVFPRKPPTSLDLFWQNVDEQREKRSADPEGWSFTFKSFVDEYVCAYNALDPIDQKAITH
jgi:hypothetical protein